MSFRTVVLERDESQFISNVSNQNGAMVVISAKGRSVPDKCFTTQDVLTISGNPSSDFPSVQEALNYVAIAPLWLVSAYGSGSRYGGVDVRADGLSPFGSRTGRILQSFGYSASTPREAQEYQFGTGNGHTASFSGTLPNTPIVGGTLIVKVGGVATDAVESGGVISGYFIQSGSLNLTNGAINITFIGSAGTQASFNTSIDFSSPLDFSLSGKPKAVNVVLDGVLYQNINLGNSASTTRASVITAINTAVGATIASNSGNFINFLGQVFGATGNITISDPSDLITYASAFQIFVQATGTSVNVTGTDPTGLVPKNGQKVTADWEFTESTTTTVSHSFFAYSPYTDDLAISLTYLGGKDFTVTLYQNSTLGYVAVTGYPKTYSLDKKKDNFGNSLYIFDVFRFDKRIIPLVNTNFTSAYTFTTAAQTAFTGGVRTAPLNSDIVNSWNNFKKANSYPVKTFMDALSGQANVIVSIRDTYQRFAFCSSIVPPGNDAASAVTYRQSLGLDNDQIALYTNWATVADLYNNSRMLTSLIGAIGAKYALMDDVFDALSPAGTDENSHGGQLGNYTPQVFSLEFDYADPGELSILYNGQVNPIILDENFGPMTYGDQTLKVVNSDTSFIGTRRLYNRLEKDIVTQVLRLQEFKNNDPEHRLKAKTLTEEILSPVLTAQLLRNALVVCDTSNNTNDVLNQRHFILTVGVQVTPNSQFVFLNFIRISQTQVITSITTQPL